MYGLYFRRPEEGTRVRLFNTKAEALEYGILLATTVAVSNKDCPEALVITNAVDVLGDNEGIENFNLKPCVVINRTGKHPNIRQADIIEELGWELALEEWKINNPDIIHEVSGLMVNTLLENTDEKLPKTDDLRGWVKRWADIEGRENDLKNSHFPDKDGDESLMKAVLPKTSLNCYNRIFKTDNKELKLLEKDKQKGRE